jgi:starch synthase (maltosyl-transferring)
MPSPMIYNLFPRLTGEMTKWPAHARRAAEMGFDWIFVNPVQYPGFSGSLYAVKDFYRLNPLFIPEGELAPMEALGQTIEAFHRLGLKVMLDLVINHTAKDSELIRDRPKWFRWEENGDVKSPSAIDPADARKVTVWGDLAEVDNAGSADRQNLWAFWTAVVQYYLEMGFDGFRCDAAYKVPSRLWEQLIGAARRRRPDALFVAETLGCRLAELRGLRSAGFDYLFNSSKWWQFDAPWCLEQHEEFGALAPSIAFPESHDTPRLMQETGGLVQVQQQRYAFAAVFSSGLMMPIGYEYGFTKKLDVVKTMPRDWERTDLDLSAFIRGVNGLKRSIPVLGVEGHWELLAPLNQPTTALRKSEPGLDPVIVLVNKDWRAPQPCRVPVASGRLIRPFLDTTPVSLPGDTLRLEPAEIVLVLP